MATRRTCYVCVENRHKAKIKDLARKTKNVEERLISLGMQWDDLRHELDYERLDQAAEISKHITEAIVKLRSAHNFVGSLLEPWKEKDSDQFDAARELGRTKDEGTPGGNAESS